MMSVLLHDSYPLWLLASSAAVPSAMTPTAVMLRITVFLFDNNLTILTDSKLTSLTDSKLTAECLQPTRRVVAPRLHAIVSKLTSRFCEILEDGSRQAPMSHTRTFRAADHRRENFVRLRPDEGPGRHRSIRDGSNERVPLGAKVVLLATRS
jgi:hypothetical protein